MKKLLISSALLGLIFFSPGTCFPQETEQKSLTGIEFLTGFGWGKLRDKGNYNIIPLSVAFDFNLKKLTQKINFSPKQLLQFQVEPFLSPVTQPEADLETGLNFWLKMGFVPETWKFQPYFKLGAGLLYMTLHTHEQGTQFNFTEQCSLGMHYYFTKNTAFTLEGRWRHLSNSGIKQPNHGINTYFLNTGVSYRF